MLSFRMAFTIYQCWTQRKRDAPNIPISIESNLYQKPKNDRTKNAIRMHITNRRTQLNDNRCIEMNASKWYSPLENVNNKQHK